MTGWTREWLAALLAVALALAVAMVARSLGRADWFDANYGPIFIVTTILAFVMMFRLDRTLRWRGTKRFQSAYRDAIARGDAAGAKREIERIYGTGSLARDVTKLYEASSLSRAGRFEESLRLVGTIPSESADQRVLPLILNQTAWCKAHTGNAHEAVVTAREALDRASKTTGDSVPRWMAVFRGTLGASLSLAGRPDDALTHLSRELKDHQEPESRAVVAYHMGTAYEALGPRDEPRASFERSMREAPESLFGKRAQSRLLKGYPVLDR